MNFIYWPKHNDWFRIHNGGHQMCMLEPDLCACLCMDTLERLHLLFVLQI